MKKSQLLYIARSLFFVLFATAVVGAPLAGRSRNASAAAAIKAIDTGDVWTVDFGNDDVIDMPGGDPSKAKFYCQAANGKPNRESPCKLNAPFYLATDQQNRIWAR